MEKITISLIIDVSNNIKITNSSSNQEIIIKDEDKKLNAEEVFKLLSYKIGNTYEIKSNLEDIKGDDKKYNYFKDIVDLFNSISDGINKMDEKEDLN